MNIFVKNTRIVEKRKLYIAYGSNMNRQQMLRRCPKASPAGTGVIHGWKLVMRGVADIVRSDEDFVPVALWWVTRECLDSLDAYEGAPYLYQRRVVSAFDGTARRPRTGFVYIMTEPSRRGLRAGNISYVRGIIDGYGDFGIVDTSPIWAAQVAAHNAVKLVRKNFEVRSTPKRRCETSCEDLCENLRENLNEIIDLVNACKL